MESGLCFSGVGCRVWFKTEGFKGIYAIGVDEIQWKKNHQYLTLVYEISKESVCLLWIGEKRTEKSFRKFFDLLGEKSKEIKKMGMNPF